MIKKRGFKFFTSKKGMDIDLWFNVLEFVMVFTIALVLFDFVNSEVRNTAFEKSYLARDNALLLNTIYASPGNIQYNYIIKPNNFIFDFKPSQINVYEQHETVEGGGATYIFAEDKNYNILYTKLLLEPSDSRITYAKTESTIKIDK